ncbi:hypothetical protein [Antiquaquibacter soli]|uniref:Uncharacterized protein n=1 Tax=Antiquaquibacter soli TaxID=3064523 RepID=A0ABT9BMN1_9MICO|nr:hypothetical protein [Protaetiibacter sp. WY-16]MDO7881677.1 hypothetical protein [Protaetiibacter sp. WY-16]
MSTEPLGPADLPEPPEPPDRQRRVAVGPLVLVAVGVLAAIVFAAVVWALAGAGAPGSPEAEPSIPPPAAVAPTPTATSAPRVAGPNECVDARGDGTGTDLDSIGLSADGGDLRVVFVLSEPLPDTDATLELYTESAAARVQIAVAFEGGSVDEFVVYRLPSGDDDERDDDERDNGKRGPGSGREDPGLDEGERVSLKKRDVVVEGSVIVATVGKGVLDELGDSFLWYAAATVDHEPADSCYLPDGALVPFER